MEELRRFQPPYTPDRSAQYLDSALLTLPKLRRAWERVPHPPRNPESRISVVYKTTIRQKPIDPGDVRDAKRIRLEHCRAVGTAFATEARDFEKHKSPSSEEPAETTTVSPPAELDPQRAILEQFVARYDASRKAGTVVSRRESLRNKRDSDIVRKALASPRQPLEAKDTNVSPVRPEVAPSLSHTPPQVEAEATKNEELLSSLSTEPQETYAVLPDSSIENATSADADAAGRGSPSLRRSTRERKPFKAHQLATPTATSKAIPKISIRRTDKNDTTVVHHEELEWAAIHKLTMANTRKNKNKAIKRDLRLLQIRAEADAAAEAGLNMDELLKRYDVVDDGDTSKHQELKKKAKSVQWSEVLVIGYQEAPVWAGSETRARSAALQKTPAVKLALPSGADKISGELDSNDHEPKKRAVRRLGRCKTRRQTPMKTALPSTLLPDEIAAEADASREAEMRNRIIRSVPDIADNARSNAAMQSALSVNVNVNSASTALKKRRLPTPSIASSNNTRSLTLTPSTASVSFIGKLALPVATADGKENAPSSIPVSRIPSPKKTSIGTPATIAVSAVVIPTMCTPARKRTTPARRKKIS